MPEKSEARRQNRLPTKMNTATDASSPVFVTAGALAEGNERPIFVDLDGTLLRTDVFLESLIILLKANFPKAMNPLIGLLRGPAPLKRYVAQHVPLSASNPPLNEPLVRYLYEQYEAGREIYLATGADRIHAEQMVEQLPIFSGIVASDGVTNHVGSAKLSAIQEICGERSFTYVGNSRSDLPIWREAAGAITVNLPSNVFVQLMDTSVQVEASFSDRWTFADWSKSLRPLHWIKNVLVFVPLALAHRFTELPLLLSALLGFGCFCCCSSAVYLLNDVLDAPSDRLSVTKKDRPIASGRLPIVVAIWSALSLMIAAVLAAAMLPPPAAAIIGLYFVGNLAYSLFLKSNLFIDVVILAGFYAARVLFGGAVTGIPISIWTMGFSIFLFLSLALSKRLSELRSAQFSRDGGIGGRGYLLEDIQQIASFGSSSSYVAVLVLALYLNSAEVVKAYHRPNLLWLLCPLIIYWTSRLWLLANRGWIVGDPIVFAVRDRASIAVAIAAASILLLAI